MFPIATGIVIVGSMERLMEVADQMEDEFSATWHSRLPPEQHDFRSLHAGRCPGALPLDETLGCFA